MIETALLRCVSIGERVCLSARSLVANFLLVFGLGHTSWRGGPSQKIEVENPTEDTEVKTANNSTANKIVKCLPYRGIGLFFFSVIKMIAFNFLVNIDRSHIVMKSLKSLIENLIGFLDIIRIHI